MPFACDICHFHGVSGVSSWYCLSFPRLVLDERRKGVSLLLIEDLHGYTINEIHNEIHIYTSSRLVDNQLGISKKFYYY